MRYHPEFMRSDKGAATDVLSSIPIIACCIVSVMILVGSVSQIASRGAADHGSEPIDESCDRLLSAAMERITSMSDDGVRYLAHDWFDRLNASDIETVVGPGLSASVIVRVLGQPQSDLRLIGDIALCGEVRSASAPVLFISCGRVSPGEVTALVGR